MTVSKRLAFIPVIAAAAATLAACGATSAARAGGSSHGCAARGKTIAQTAGVRLYRVGNPDGTAEPKYFLCSSKTGHSYRVDGTDPEDYVSKKIAVAGNEALVAVIGHAGEDLGTLHPTVLNLATGQKRSFNTSAEDFSTLKLTALAVNAQGAAAWVYEQFPLDPGEGIRQRQVQKGDANGAAVLDDGLGIDPSSLKLTGDTLTWTDSGQQKTATLTP
jgi:hypothetical protein